MQHRADVLVRKTTNILAQMVKKVVLALVVRHVEGGDCVLMPVLELYVSVNGRKTSKNFSEFSASMPAVKCPSSRVLLFLLF